MILFSHPTVDCAVRHTARALERAGVLGEFWTYHKRHPGPEFHRLLPEEFTAIVCAPASSHEDARAIAGDGDHLSTDRGYDGRGSWLLDRHVSARLQEDMFNGVYAYAGSAADTFVTAGRRGLLRIYDVPDATRLGWHEILEDEAAREPEWAHTLVCESPDSLARKWAELQQADLVVVPSSFDMHVLDTKPDFVGTAALVRPGAPSLTGRREMRPPGGKGDRLRVLFAGGLGQRAGLSYLFHACEALSPAVELTIVGPRPAATCTPLNRALQQCRWIPDCSWMSLQREMVRHDVFVFPAVFESGTSVLMAALTSGLPVIATDHCAAPDLIQDGREGFLVPIRSSAMIIEKLDLLRRDPELLRNMSRMASARSARLSWERYEQALAATVTTALQRHCGVASF